MARLCRGFHPDEADRRSNRQEGDRYRLRGRFLHPDDPPAGAAKVTGVDLSEKMIGLARASEAQEPLGIDYIVGDGRDLEVAAGLRSRRGSLFSELRA